MTVTVYLAHGASGTAASMAPHVSGLARLGVPARAVGLPKGTAERAVPVYERQIEDLARSIIGGQSFGGRVASLLAAGSAADAARPRGIVLLCYPLHPPGAPDTWQKRAAHLPAVHCPTLFLSGDRDPLGRRDLLETAVASVPDARLVLYPGLGHWLTPVLDEVLAEIATFWSSLGD